MVPADFARGKPRRFSLPGQWGAIEARYAGLGPSDPFSWLCDHLRDLGANAALLEHEYLDRDYREEYRKFYAQTYRWVPDRCERLHFWKDQQYLGYTSIRPIVGRPVGRTMIDPGAAFEQDLGCFIQASATPYGRDFSVPAFPFISQDRQYGRCAHAVVWMIAHYHHLRNRTPERFMSDIVRAAAREETERVVPSPGLTDDQVGSAFHQLGLEAIRYEIGNDSLPEDMVLTVVTRFMNSGIPLALGTPGHLTAIIGAAYGEDGSLEVLQCDDEQGAYVRKPIELTGDDRWEVLFVPLPGRIYLGGEDVAPAARAALKQLAQENDVDLRNRTLRYREYVVDVRDYKRRLFERQLPAEVAAAHAQVPSARWLWIVEVQDAELARLSPRCVLGEIGVDATSDEHDLIHLFANLPGLRAVWRRDEVEPEVARFPIESLEPYETGTSLNL